VIRIREQNVVAAMWTVGLLFLALEAPSAAATAEYPTKPIRMVVGFAAAGGADTTARIIAVRLGDRIGQRVIVDNRPGAAGNIATQLVANAEPDGYTILMGTIAALSINPSLYRGKLPFDPIKDLAPVVRAVDSTNILSLNQSVPASNVKELIALAKASSLTYGSSGVGAPSHLAGELFNVMAGVKMTHVPYKGGVPAMVDLISGQVQLMYAGATSAFPHIKTGKIKAIAVTTAKRSALFPSIPTISESGLPGFDANNWYGIVAPKKVPPAIIARLNSEIAKVLAMSEVKELLAAQGLEPAADTPAQFGAYIQSETVKWSKVVKESGARID
jgi:tripartite-type tricarboxylate transporter receptor subunit TctC